MSITKAAVNCGWFRVYGPELPGIPRQIGKYLVFFEHPWGSGDLIPWPEMAVVDDFGQLVKAGQ